MGSLYLVSTPIGNLEDITLRALRLLFTVDIIACEDTRKTGLFLKRLEDFLVKLPTHSFSKKVSRPKLLSYYEENEARRIPQIIGLLKKNKDVALVTNAGTPTISDPGFKLVRECIRQKIKVIPVPGSSALLTALVVSGLPTDKFLFLGFLPKKPGKRKKLFQRLHTIRRRIRCSVVFFESPHRLVKSLKNLQEVFGDIEIVVCRELTKMHEEIKREKVSQAIAYFRKNRPKGEFTLLFSLSKIN